MASIGKGRANPGTIQAVVQCKRGLKSGPNQDFGVKGVSVSSETTENFAYRHFSA